MKTMGDRIKEKRQEKGYTMEDLAEKLNVGKSAVNKWEKGHVKNIKRETIQKIATILDCTPSYLFGWDDNEVFNVTTEWEEVKPVNAFEMTLVEAYREAPPEIQDAILVLLKMKRREQ